MQKYQFGRLKGFQNRVAVQSFCFGLLISLYLALSAKNEEVWRPFTRKIQMKEHELGKEYDTERICRGSLPFAFKSISLSM
jgi:hypothetical protein